MQKVTINGESFYASKKQAEALEELTSTRAGGMATIKGYVSESDRIKPETADIQFLSRFSYFRLLGRRIAALEALDVKEVRKAAKAKDLLDLTPAEFEAAFNARRATMIAGHQKTLAGDRSDAHRQGHDRCYIRIAEGLRVNFKTADVNGIKQPVTLADVDENGVMIMNLPGLPIAENILLDIIEINRKVIVEGEYKPKKSGIPVLMENAMQTLLPKGVKFKALSLKPENFDSLHIDGKEITPEDVPGYFH